MTSVPDERFARLKTDPRFRRPKQKQLKVEIDSRFKDVLESEEFGGKGKGKGKASDVKVDKRGRPLAGSHHQDQVKRFYRLRSPSPSASGSKDAAEGEEAPTFVDYARGDGYLSSSGSEDDEEESEAEEEELEIGGKRRVVPRPGYESADDSDSDDDSQASGSHLKIDLEEDEDEEGESAFPLEVIGEGDEEDEEEDDGPTTDPTTRIAAVNLDWDNLRAADLYAVFNSFIKEGGRKIKGAKEMKGEGKLLGVKIYPSEFGKERMKREEMEGPGGGMFVSKSGASKSGGKGKGKRVEGGSDDEDEESGSELDDEEEMSEMGSGSDEGLVELDSDMEDDGEDLSDDDEDVDDEEEEDDGLPASGKANAGDDISDVSSDAGSEDIDMDQLRQYQLERLRYYYAIATFSTVAAAEHVMEECNGTEFERTANVLDLTFVPDGMEFSDDDLHDQATKEPRGYKGTDFVTDALRHSKVRLTWDQDDPNRSKLTRKAMTREEIEEQDFKNLVAGSDDSGSDSEDDSEIDNPAEELAGVGVGGKTKKITVGGVSDAKAKKAKVKERKDKLRALLLAGNEDDGDIWGKAGLGGDGGFADDSDGEDVQAKAGGGGGKGKKGGVDITFKPALAEGAALEDDNLTTLERYQLRMKEKKSRKKEKLEMKRGMKGGDGSDEETAPKAGAEGDDFFGGDSEDEVVVAPKATKKDSKSKSKDIPTPISKLSKVAPTTTAKATTTTATKPIPAPVEPELHADLKSAMDKEHFSMKDIIKDEKTDGKRKRKRASQAKKEARNEALGRTRETELGQEGWKIDVKDSRFKALHEEPEFAIDPSNPHFTKTKAMKDLLAERARVRQDKRGGDDGPVEPALKKASNSEGSGPKERDLSALVQSVKRKMESNNGGPAKSGRKRHRK